MSSSGAPSFAAIGGQRVVPAPNCRLESPCHSDRSERAFAPGSLTCYFYDAFGRRVQKVDAATSCGYPISGGTSLYYVYDLDGNVIDEVSAPSGGTGNWTRQEIYAGGRHLATLSAATGQAYWDFTDWLGTERARVNAVTGAVVETCTSLPWGDNLKCAGADQSPLHFTGKQRDPESGLDNFEARYVASSFGRFISPDLLGGVRADPQSLNRYVYARDNPLNLIDPSGLDPQSAQNCIYSIYSGATATDCYPSSAGDDQIAQNHGQGQNPPPPPPPCSHAICVTSYHKLSFWDRVKSWFSGGDGTSQSSGDLGAAGLIYGPKSNFYKFNAKPPTTPRYPQPSGPPEVLDTPNPTEPPPDIPIPGDTIVPGPEPPVNMPPNATPLDKTLRVLALVGKALGNYMADLVYCVNCGICDPNKGCI